LISKVLKVKNYFHEIQKNKFNKNTKYFLGAKELSRVIYSADRGKLETVLLKPGGSSAVGTKGSLKIQ